eukprot:2028011-Amphidinium_carterae.1
MLRSAIDELLASYGKSVERKRSDRQAAIHFRRIHALAELAGDADFDYLVNVAEEGVLIGYHQELPWVEGVFEEK